MILEVAVLNVKPGEATAFESAFAVASKIIAASPGYVSLELQRCLEVEHQYILLVRWQTLEDHTEGFRQSEPYQEWRRLLHHFYDPCVALRGCFRPPLALAGEAGRQLARHVLALQ